VQRNEGEAHRAGPFPARSMLLPSYFKARYFCLVAVGLLAQEGNAIVVVGTLCGFDAGLLLELREDPEWRNHVEAAHRPRRQTEFARPGRGWALDRPQKRAHATAWVSLCPRHREAHAAPPVCASTRTRHRLTHLRCLSIL